jgi:predicted RNase H-like HicB family nuclease
MIPSYQVIRGKQPSTKPSTGSGGTSWGAYVPDPPGCVAVGDSPAEVEALIVEAIA